MIANVNESPEISESHPTLGNITFRTIDQPGDIVRTRILGDDGRHLGEVASQEISPGVHRTLGHGFTPDAKEAGLQARLYQRHIGLLHDRGIGTLFSQVGQGAGINSVWDELLGGGYEGKYHDGSARPVFDGKRSTFHIPYASVTTRPAPEAVALAELSTGGMGGDRRRPGLGGRRGRLSPVVAKADHSDYPGGLNFHTRYSPIEGSFWGNKTTFSINTEVSHGGKVIGSLSSTSGFKDPNVPKVAISMVNPRHRGKGVGRLLYQHHIDALHQMGYEEVESGLTTSPQARRVWDALIDRLGYAGKRAGPREPNATGENIDQVGGEPYARIKTMPIGTALKLSSEDGDFDLPYKGHDHVIRTDSISPVAVDPVVHLSDRDIHQFRGDRDLLSPTGWLNFSVLESDSSVDVVLHQAAFDSTDCAADAVAKLCDGVLDESGGRIVRLHVSDQAAGYVAPMKLQSRVAIEKAPQERATGKQWSGMLRGVSPTDMHYSGLKGILDAAGDKVIDRQSILSHPDYRAPGVRTTHLGYAHGFEPAGPAKYEQWASGPNKNYGETLWHYDDPRYSISYPGRTHFDDMPNALMHARHSEIDHLGQPSFMLHEIQSDPMQALRRSGGQVDLPIGPKNWHKHAMKWALREAAERGLDRLSWASGDMLSGLYGDSISQHVDNLNVSKSGNNYLLDIMMPNGQRRQMGQDGEISDANLADYIGVGLAKRAADHLSASTEPLNITAQDVNDGFAGMGKFYDEILPNYMNDYLRKYGVVASRAPWTDDDGKTHSIHSVGITPEMKRWLLHEGQAMLSESAAQSQEWVKFTDLPSVTQEDIANHLLENEPAFKAYGYPDYVKQELVDAMLPISRGVDAKTISTIHAVHPDTVMEYGRMMLRGSQAPPVTMAGGHIVEGNHRTHAARLAKRPLDVVDIDGADWASYISDDPSKQSESLNFAGRTSPPVAKLSEISMWNGEDPLDSLPEPEQMKPPARAPVAPAFYSKLDRAIEQKLPNNVTGRQALNTLIGAGVKPEELKHSKVQELLEHFSDAPLPKSAIRDKADTYGVHVKPILRSDRANFNMSFDTARALHRDGHPVFGIHGITGEATDFGDLDFSGEPSKPYAYTFYPGEVSNKIERSSGLAKWRDYRLGGPRSNYNEMQLQLLVPGSRKLESFAKAAQEKYGLQWRGQLDDNERAEYSRLHDIQRSAPSEFYGNHWDEGNVLAHARFDDRTLGDGSRAMHVAEIQSDWHQSGRKEGYRDSSTIAALEDELNAAADAQDAARLKLPEWKAYIEAINDFGTTSAELDGLGEAYRKAYNALPESERAADVRFRLSKAINYSVPDAPFKKNWHELMFKHLLQHAVDQGYDALSWDTGHTNAERFQQRKPMHQISWQPSTGELWGINDELGEHKIADGVTDKNLAQHVGKNAAEKLLAGDSEKEKYLHPEDGPTWRVVDGRGLMAGGAGMVGFYDKMLPEFVNKYLRHVGGSVEQGGLPGMFVPFHGAPGRWMVSPLDGESEDPSEFGSYDEAEAASKARLHPVHVVKITPQIREWIRREGQVTLNESIGNGGMPSSPITNPPQPAKGMTDDEKHEHFYNDYRRAEEDVLDDFRRDMDSKQPWPVVPAGRLKKIWRDHANMGFVRDEKGLDEIADRMIQNVHRLHVNTGMCAHDTYDPADVWSNHFDDLEWDDDISEKFGDHVEDENGQWRISDYATEPLWNDAFELKFETDPTKRLMIIDRMLNRVHARSDMAANFVEGGSATLDEIAGNARKSSLPLLSEIEAKTPRGLREAAIVALSEPAVAEPVAKPESGVHSIHTDHMDSHRGENYYETHARDKNGGLLGYASWSDMGGHGDMYLKHVEVRGTHRRRGIASAIYDHIRNENPGRSIRTFGGFRTGDGQAFREAYDKRSGIAPAEASARKPKQTDSQEFRDWFGMSKVHHPHTDTSRPVEPMVVYHGTTRNFDTFDLSKANKGGDHGAGFYFTDDPEDLSANYASENGPDVQNRFEGVKERIDSENYENPLPEEEVERLARAEIFEHGGASMPVYLRMENPLHIGGDDEEFWDSTYEGDPDDEDYYAQEPTGKIHDFIDGLRRAANELDADNVDVDKVVEDLQDYMYDGGRVSDILNKARHSEGLLYAEDSDTGELIGHEVLRLAIEKMMYDGIIDHTVYNKFGKGGRRPHDGKAVPYGMDGMTPDTTHYIAFRPEQIKSAIGNNGEFSRHLDHIGLSESNLFGSVSVADLPQDMQELLGQYFEDSGKGQVPPALFTEKIPVNLFPDAGRDPARRIDADPSSLPPIIVSGNDWLDGRHRVDNAKRRGETHIDAIDLGHMGVTGKSMGQIKGHAREFHEGLRRKLDQS